MNYYKDYSESSPIWIIGIGLLTLLPNTNRWQYVRIGLLVIAFVHEVLLKRRGIVSGKEFSYLVILLFGMGISSFSVLIVEHTINGSIVIHELLRIMMNSMMIILLFHKKIKIEHLLCLSTILVLAIFTVQLLQSVIPVEANKLIRRYYVEEGSIAYHLDLALESRRNNFRAGAFLINPNICACAVALCCPQFFLGIEFQKYKKLSKIMLAVSLISIVLSGSRTGLIVYTVIVAYKLLSENKSSKKKAIIIAIALLGFFALSLLVEFGQLSLGYRSLDISEGLEKSLIAKFSNLLTYIQLANPLYLFTGSLGGLSSRVQIDAEWGYFFSYFGIAGIAWYIKLIKEISIGCNWIERICKKQYALIICLVALTETIVMCMPIANLFFVFALSNVSELEVN